MNVIGYTSEDDQLYGISWDKRAFLTSSDHGNTWASCSPAKMLRVKAQPDYVAAQEVPWIVGSEKTSGKWKGKCLDFLSLL